MADTTAAAAVAAAAAAAEEEEAVPFRKQITSRAAQRGLTSTTSSPHSRR